MDNSSNTSGPSASQGLAGFVHCEGCATPGACTKLGCDEPSTEKQLDRLRRMHAQARGDRAVSAVTGVPQGLVTPDKAGAPAMYPRPCNAPMCGGEGALDCRCWTDRQEQLRAAEKACG